VATGQESIKAREKKKGIRWKKKRVNVTAEQRLDGICAVLGEGSGDEKRTRLSGNRSWERRGELLHEKTPLSGGKREERGKIGGEVCPFVSSFFRRF